ASGAGAASGAGPASGTAGSSTGLAASSAACCSTVARSRRSTVFTPSRAARASRSTPRKGPSTRVASSWRPPASRARDTFTSSPGGLLLDGGAEPPEHRVHAVSRRDVLALHVEEGLQHADGLLVAASGLERASLVHEQRGAPAQAVGFAERLGCLVVFGALEIF